jgi:nitrogen fixation protein FixH
MNTSAWRWFPHSLIATMVAVFLVNAYMVYDAYSTFPGSAGRDGFDLSNEYKRVLQTAQQQAALGWRVDAEAAADGSPVLRLTGADGKAIVADQVAAQAERPVGPANVTKLNISSTGGGVYRADAPLAPGQWDIMLEVLAGGHQFNATRRVAVK